MSNTITIELCAEDRARLDRVANLMEAQITLTQFIIDNAGEKPKPTEQDEDIKKIATEALAKVAPIFDEGTEAEKTAQDATEKTTPTVTPQTEETPTVKEEPKPTEAKRVVSRTELGAKVREMMTKGFKEETKAIVKDYAPTVPGVPEDKVTECYERLSALEG